MIFGNHGFKTCLIFRFQKRGFVDFTCTVALSHLLFYFHCNPAVGAFSAIGTSTIMLFFFFHLQ
jgi:hypothetical protein